MRAEVWNATIRKLDDSGHTNERDLVLDFGRRLLKVETRAGIMNKLSGSRGWADIPFQDIEETRPGFKSDLFDKYFKATSHQYGTLQEDDQDRCMSIIYMNTKRFTTIGASAHQTLSVIFPDAQLCKKWTQGLENAIKGTIFGRGEWMTPTERKISEAWFAVAPRDNQHHETFITLKQLSQVLDEANIWVPEPVLEKVLTNEGLRTPDRVKNGEWTLSGIDFYRHILPILRRRPWLEQMFCRVARRDVVVGSTSNMLQPSLLRPSQPHVPADATIGFDEFIKFIRNVQMDTERTDEEWRTIFNQYAPTPPPITGLLSGDQLDTMSPEQLLAMTRRNPQSPPEGRMGFYGFLNFIHGVENAVFTNRAKAQAPYQDMTKPLNNYWIRSSHNTYLVGDQLKGTSSPEGFIFALKSGVRCVELDIWDGANGEPCVTHGHTLVNKTPLKDCLFAIKEYAFHKTDYPVILSIEQHAGLQQQAVMAEQLKMVFGDSLVDAPVPGIEKDGCASPEQLRGKVLLKHKRLGVVEDVEEPSTPTLAQSPTTKEKAPEGIAPEMSKLAVYCVNGGFSNLKDHLPKAKAYLCSSIVESKSETLATAEREKYMEFTAKQMVRVYPRGGRVASTNYNPWPHWSAGWFVSIYES